MQRIIQKLIKSLFLLGILIIPLFSQANYYFTIPQSIPGFTKINPEDYFSVEGTARDIRNDSADLVAKTRWSRNNPSSVAITFHYFLKYPIITTGSAGTVQQENCKLAINNPSTYITKSIGPFVVDGAKIPRGESWINVETVETVSNLFPKTTYFYCASLTTQNKQYFTSIGSFTTRPADSQTKTGGILKRTEGPDLIGNVTTYQASRTSDTEAIFAGDVDRVSGQAYAYFRYAALEKPPLFCNDIYGSAQRSATATIPNAYGKIPQAGGFSTIVRGLSPDTNYYYCAIVSNSAINPTEIEYGPVQSFRTLPCQTCPQTYITTVRAYNIGSNVASFRGQYRSIPSVELYFEYRKEGDLEWKKTPTNQNPPSKTYGNFWDSVSGLEKSTVYQFRAVGEVTNTSKIPGALPTGKIFFGDTLTFKTTSGNLFDGGGWSPGPYIGPTNEEEENGEKYTGDGDCKDNVQNGDETGVDTGGRCAHIGTEGKKKCPPNCTIPPLPNCQDGIQNGRETGIDTGGDCPPEDPDNPNNGGGNSGGGGNGGGGGIPINPNNTTTFGGTAISSGGNTTISNGTTITQGGNTTVSGGNTTVNGGGSSIKNATVTNVGGTATTQGGTTTIRGGTTTVKYKGPNGEEKKCISTGTVTVAHANNKSTVVCNNEVIIINDGEGVVENVGGVVTTNNGTTTLTGGKNTLLNDSKGLKIGDRATPPNDAIVRYHEGIETVFTRQIIRNIPFARLYGYEDGMDLQHFAETLAHTFTTEYFGYIDETGLEVRVARPDVSAYELRQVGGVLNVYEYYENIIIDIRNTTTIFKNKNPYEYYDRRRR